MSGSDPIRDEDAAVTTDWRWAQIPEDLLYDPAISSTAVRVYGCLVRHGTTPDSCFPSHARIAEKLGLAKRSVARPLAELEEAGWITRIPRFNGRGDRVADGYDVLVAATPAAHLSAPTTRSSAAPGRDPARHQDAKSRGHKGEPLNESHEGDSSSSSARRAPTAQHPDDHEEEETATPTLTEQAAALHADRAHRNRPEGPASRPSRWKAVAADEWLTEHANACASYLAENPAMTALELVAKVERGYSNPGYVTKPPVELHEVTDEERKRSLADRAAAHRTVGHQTEEAS